MPYRHTRHRFLGARSAGLAAGRPGRYIRGAAPTQATAEEALARFHDEDELEKVYDFRMLLRLWLTTHYNRALPPGHEVLWREIEAGRPRGGIAQTNG